MKSHVNLASHHNVGIDNLDITDVNDFFCFVQTP